MNIQFCDICNESVPQVDLDEKRALMHNGRVVCVNCDAAMSKGTGPHPHGLASDRNDPQHAAPRSPAAHPAALSVPPVYATGSSGSAVAVMGLLLATLAIVLLSVAAVFGMDRLAALDEARSGEVRALRGELASLSRSLESDVADARQSSVSDSAAIAGRLDALGADLREAGQRSSADVAALRDEIAALRTRVASAGAVEERIGANTQRFEAVDRELQEIRDDLAVIARRVLEVEQLGPALVAATEAAKNEAPPEWMSIVDELDDPNAGNRWFAVTGLGDTGDVAVVPYLLPMLKDEDIFVRMATARILGDLRADSAVGALIDALEDEETSVREAAVVSLRVITGRNFKFDPFGQDSERARRVKAWRDWWEKAGPPQPGD